MHKKKRSSSQRDFNDLRQGSILIRSRHLLFNIQGKQGKAWYAFGGKEHETTDFHHLETPVKTHLQKSS